MTDDEKFEQSVTRALALASLMRPDLVTRVSPEEARRIAAECLIEERRNEIPEAFWRAFE